MPSRRTVRKPTRWTPEEWRQIEDAAQKRGVPPLRYVREAALAAKLPTRVRLRAADKLIRHLRRVLENLHQLRRLADENGAVSAAAAIDTTIQVTEEAGVAATGRNGSASALTADLRDAGQFLDELTHQAHVAEELPVAEVLGQALVRIQAAVRQVPL